MLEFIFTCHVIINGRLYLVDAEIIQWSKLLKVFDVRLSDAEEKVSRWQAHELHEKKKVLFLKLYKNWHVIDLLNILGTLGA